ncbi:unnamed protein product [Absidia cylindrospora]
MISKGTKKHVPDDNEMDAHHRKRSHTNTVKYMADTNTVETLAHFLNESDFDKFHQYRLESHGILQVGQHLERQPDVPSSFYDNIALEDNLTCRHHSMTVLPLKTTRQPFQYLSFPSTCDQRCFLTFMAMQQEQYENNQNIYRKLDKKQLLVSPLP